MKTLPDINLDFHEHATRYQGGDILIMIEQSLPMVNAFGLSGVAFDHALASAAHVRTIHPRARVVFYGGDNGLHEIDVDAPRISVDLPDKSAPKVTAAMRAVAEQYPDTSPCNPLHIIMLAAGGLGSPYSETMEAMLAVMQKPGAQVMLDVILMPGAQKTFQQMAGVAGSKMLHNGEEIDPSHPAPNFFLARSVEDIPREIGNAVNKRTSPKNPEEFLLNLMCSIVGKGTCAPVACPNTARFKKTPKL